MAPRDVRAAREAGVGEHVIEVRGLVKRYPDITAVDGIDFNVNRGEVFSLLGPNGAGKTTTVEILEGLRDPTAGEARVLGEDVRSGYRRIRERVGVLPQDFEPFDRLRPREAVAYWARLFDHAVSEAEVASIIDTVGLADRANTFALNLSGGEKRRLGIAMALVGQPELLFLDEPTTGLDPGARRELWTLIGDLKRKGRTILLTTHYLDDAEQLTDDVAILNHGRILADVSGFGRQYLRSGVGTCFALALPVILILLFGAIFSSSGTPRVPLAVQDLDSTPASRGFVQALNNTTLITYQAIPTNANFQDYMRAHSINVALQIPTGFQATLIQAQMGNASAKVNVTLAGDRTQSSFGIVYSAVAAVATLFNPKVANATDVVSVGVFQFTARQLGYIDFF